MLAPAGLEDRIMLRCVVGSRAYGLDREGSDTDRRGCYLAPAELQWSLAGAPEQLVDQTTQDCYWELGKLIRLALKANPTVLECLSSPIVEHATQLGRELLAMRAAFWSRLATASFAGYADAQFAKLERARRRDGRIRWTHAMHLLRLLLEGTTLLRDGVLEPRVTGHRDRLLAVRDGEVAWDEVIAWRARLTRDLHDAAASSPLPELPDRARADAFLIRARRAAAEEATR
jgi:predicted nucleotidyltransferase